MTGIWDNACLPGQRDRKRFACLLEIIAQPAAITYSMPPLSPLPPPVPE